MAMPLFDLDPDYAALADLPLEAPLLSEESDRLMAVLDDLREELSPKLLAVAKVVRTLDSEAELLEEHARALNGRSGTRRRRAEYLKRWMQLQMEGAEVDRLKDPFVTVWLQKSPPSIHVVDEAAVPQEYKRVTLRLPLSAVPPGLLGLVQTCDVDRGLILSSLKELGELVPGTSYREGTRHLRIR
jgi:hypothetical protein